jgi:lipoprotein-anchoring transpeptidase ErfK/SrfK
MKMFLVLLALLLASQAHAAPRRVNFDGYSPGTIVVKTSERRLYLMLGYGQALQYVVGVGRAGRQWSGTSQVDGKYIQPAWQAPPDLRGRYSSQVIPGGDPRNPMGVAALTIANTEYAIHGTNQPSRVGSFVSNGCIRLTNDDIMDLFHRVQKGTPVVVIR